MPVLERKQTVLKLLEQLRGLDALKELFWTELNYERENKPLSMRGWPDSARKSLVDDPILFASGGEDNAFHVLYCRLTSDSLQRNLERPIANQLIREHPYCLFVFSDTTQSSWHFLNIKYDEKAEQRRLFRRITVRADGGLRTAAERLQMLDLASFGKELFSIPALEIQKRHDDAFDVESVTKAFYKELANWYFWALKHVRFPKDAPKEADGRDHIGVIRMITRLIFCWFVKEKGLIPETLFDQRRLDKLLKGFAPDNNAGDDSVFYKALLQNLFFATLNTEMDKRGWAKDEQNFMAHSLYRYRDLFQEPDAALALFKNIPFLNGGLFECLDRDLGEGAKARYVRIDGFSRRPDSQPVVPDFLFFGPEREEDLSADYGDKKFRKVRVRGLIHTLQRYRFTIEENTPIEQEVALDPELSGKVFENLLAAYNPETGATARKQTGSFYTPREIVDYMVDEALIAFLKGSFSTENAEVTEKRLRRLASWEESDHDFDDRETEMLIAAIDKLKALDPAVGSGAFPMGILHKLVFILGKLDPRNEQWEQRQIRRVRDAVAAAEKIEDAAIRERTVKELEQQIVGIEEAFERNELDYGRKLYLIENCLYGVDIQSIAVQIAKMRFFISLIVDQRIDPNAPNLGVRPLPNLETKFVAANTLIGIEKPKQTTFRNPVIDAKEAELRKVREKHFNAKTPGNKAKYREMDKKLRSEVAELLKRDGWGDTTAKQLAAWDPYDQNASAPFFDPEWMFGVRDGFDVVIGNPPYGLLNKRQNKAEAIAVTDDQLHYFKKCVDYLPAQGGMINIYRLFIIKSIHLLSKNGTFSEIFPLAFVGDSSAAALRKWILENCQIRFIEAFPERDSINKRVFEAAKMSVCILVLQRQHTPDHSFVLRIHADRFVDESNSKTMLSMNNIALLDKANVTIPLLSQPDLELLIKIYRQSSRVGEIGHCYTGEIDLTLGKEYISHSPKDAPLLRGAIIDRYMIRQEMSQGEFLYLKTAKYLAEVGGKKALHFQYSRIGMQGITGVNEKVRLKMTILPPNVFCANSVNYMMLSKRTLDLKFALGILNSRLLNYVFSKFSTNSNVNGYEVDNLPFPEPSDSKLVKAVSCSVTHILGAKAADPSADTTVLEKEINRIVYELYGLTEEEIAIVEGASI